MCTLNMTFEVPDSRAIDIEALKLQIYDIVNVIIARPSLLKSEKKDVRHKELDMSVFDCFSGNFGGDRDAHEIADELHDSRVFTRNAPALS